MKPGFRRLLHRIDVLHASPLWLRLGSEAQDAFDDRLLDASELDDLEGEDRELLRRACLEVAAGRSETLLDPADWGDVAAIDAAADAEDWEALEAAFDTIGGYGAAVVDDAPSEEPSDAGPLDDDGFPAVAEGKGFDFVADEWDGEWVGV